MSETPSVSVILVVAHQRARAELALASVLAQEGVDEVEILVVDSAAGAYPPLPGCDQPGVRVLIPPNREDFGEMKAEAVRQATGDFVLFIEDHVQAQPGWLRALSKAFDGPWVAVGTQVENANPYVGLSPIVALVNYGLWAPPVDRGEADLLAGNNTAYRREALLAYGDTLGSMLVSDTVLQWHLQSRGGRLFVETGAVIRHLNPTTLRNCLLAEFYYHWPFAGVRAEAFGWSFWQTLRYLVLSPVIPWLRLRRLLKLNAQKGLVTSGKLIPHLPHLVLILYSAVLGQAAGLISGPDRGVTLFTEFELNSPRPADGE